jgi:hypothetical protein
MKITLILELIFTILLNFNVSSQTSNIIISVKCNSTGKKMNFIKSISLINPYDSYKFTDLKSVNGDYLLRKIKYGEYKMEIDANYCYIKFKKDIVVKKTESQRFICSLVSNNLDIKYTVVEEKPEYPGGDSEFINFLKLNINKTNQKDFNNRLFIQFNLNVNGMTDSIIVKEINDNNEVINTNNEKLNYEINRVFKVMPLWTPAKMRGKPFPVKCSFLIN